MSTFKNLLRALKSRICLQFFGLKTRNRKLKKARDFFLVDLFYSIFGQDFSFRESGDMCISTDNYGESYAAGSVLEGQGVNLLKI